MAKQNSLHLSDIGLTRQRGLSTIREAQAWRLPHILSVGNNPTLMSSRSLILRDAGYLVEEAYTVGKAINLVAADSIDAILICHTIPQDDQQVLISFVREKRRLMPVLCIRSNAYESAPRTCIGVDNEPVELLNAVLLAIQPPTGSSRLAL